MEFLVAVAVMAGIGIWYWSLARTGAPRSSGLVGHSLGIVGFMLMLFSETVYTLRKRWKRFTLGRTSTWLQIHIFTGIVGPFLVVLHAAGKFNGLAGLVTLLTVIIVLSGFVGRFIYTAVPRTVDGAAVALQDLEGQVDRVNARLESLGRAPLASEALAVPPTGWPLILARGWLRWRHHRRVHHALRGIRAGNPAAAQRIEQLLCEHYRLLIQINNLAVVRQWMSWWHIFHVPLGVVLFTLALVHVAGALYYATLMR